MSIKNSEFICSCNGMELTFANSTIQSSFRGFNRRGSFRPYVTILGRDIMLNNESEVAYYEAADIPIRYK